MEGFPLSPQQRRLWRLLQGSPAYLSSCAIELRGRLDVARLRRLLEELVKRHEILRTGFVVPPHRAMPLQVIATTCVCAWQEIDLSRDPSTSWDDLFLQEPAFDLEQGPFLQALLLRRSANRHVLVLSVPALCADRRSMANLSVEIGRLYAARQEGREPELVEPLQYADISEWFNEQQAEPAARQAPWHGQDWSNPDARLPFLRPADASGPFAPALCRRRLPAASGPSSGRAIPHEAWLLACWLTLLGHSSEEPDAVVGVACDGREFDEVSQAIGLYSRHVPLSASLARTESFTSLVERVTGLLEEARSWQSYFSWESEDFFAHVFACDEVPELPSAGELELALMRQRSTTERFLVSLVALRARDGLEIELSYDPQRLDRTVAHRLMEQFSVLLESSLATPSSALGSLPLLGPSARHQLLAEWSDGGPALQPFERIDRLVRLRAAAAPARIAVETARDKVSYTELVLRVEALARSLVGIGVGPEVVVGLLVERSVTAVVAVLAVVEAGGAYLPLDVRHPRERTEFMLADAGVRVVLTTASARAEASLDAVTVVDLAAPPLPGARPLTSPAADHLAYVIYTSGSTGRPKGTLVTQRGLHNYLRWATDVYARGGDATLLHSPLTFDLTVTSLFLPLLCGRRLTLVAEEPGFESLIDELGRARDLSFLKLTPAHLEALGEHLPASVRRRCRALVIGGEALFGSAVSPWRGADTRIFNEYGPTETVVGCCVHRLPRSGVTEGPVPIGRPIRGVRLYVVDPRFQPSPGGVAGELAIGGEALARGYLGRAALSARRWVPDPFSGMGGERLYRTGDRVRYLASGDLEFLGRLDDQIKLHGYRIEPGEIESVLRRLPAVREAVALVEEETGRPRLVVGWTAAPGHGETDSDPEVIQRFLRQQLPEHMVPQLIVRLEELPTNAHGKVDRGAVLRRVCESGRRQRPAWRAPRTATERLLAEIWTEVLSIDRVGLDDHFFHLGGDSILSLQVIGRAGRRRIRLTARQIFEHPTLVELARAASEAQVTAPPAAEQGLVTGSLPLTPIQRSFLETRRTDSHHFNQQLYLELRKPLPAVDLERIVNALLRHHDALRLRFERAPSGWRQTNRGLGGPRSFSTLDFSALSERDSARALAAAAGALQGSLDLSSGPLVRAAHLRFSGPVERLLLIFHHLVVDGVSLRILREDLETASRQRLRGEEIELPPKTTSYLQWAHRLAAYAESVSLQAERDYWQTVRDGARLPRDRPGPGDTVAGTATVRVELPAALTRALLGEVHRAYRTRIDDLLLSALGLVLRQWCGGDVLVDLEGHGREEIFEDLDLSRTVGWFTSVYPVLLEVGDGVDPRATLISIKEGMRRIPQRGIGYGLLRHSNREPAGRQSRKGSRRTEVLFNYLGQFQKAKPTEGAFALVSEACGPAESPRGERRYPLEVNAVIRGARLHVEWRFHRELHRESTIRELGRRFLGQLRRLIDHCRSPEAGALTPSDFPLSRIDQAQLDGLGATYGEIEDLYPASPMQESMLLHRLAFPQSDVGLEQSVLRWRRRLDRVALRQAFQLALDRHPLLRTCFDWRVSGTPLQVVVPGCELPWTEIDLRNLEPAVQARQGRALLAADRRLGFDMAQAPLLRAILVRLDEERGDLLWSRHHVLLDGWSTALLLAELERSYRALTSRQRAQPSSRRPYRDYVAWLSRQDVSATEAYWRQRLAGVTSPTPLAADRTAALSSARGAPVSRAQEATRLDAELTTRLRELAVHLGTTVNVLLQGAWALLLSRYSGGSCDVVFGATVAGRPASLDGAESMLGLFIKNLPVRVRFTEDDRVRQLLRKLQEEQLVQSEHEAVSPADVQHLSDVPGHLPLFESLLVFENYPVESASLREWDPGPAGAGATVRTRYPVTLVAAQDPRRLIMLLVYDDERFDRTTVARRLIHLKHLLQAMSELDSTIGELSLFGAAERHQLLNEWGNPPGDFGAAPGARLLDGRRRPVPIGAVGEIHHRHADGALRPSGQQARLAPDGALQIREQPVEGVQIEEILREHPGVAEAALLEDPSDRLVAFVVATPCGSTTATELRGFLARRSPDPRRSIDFVFRDALPRSPDGEVDRDALPSPATERLNARIRDELLALGKDPLETQLLRIWQEVLGSHPIGIDDDFFDLGGTSVAALRLASRVREQFQRDLPLSLLYEATTVRSFARQLREGVEPASWSPLVAIRPGGTRRPFYCVHPVGGNVLSFVDLAARLDRERPFFGLQAAGLDGTRPPYTRLEEMAARYLAEIRRVQPDGPYLLGGLSFGGYVAFEMARQLVDAGAEVARLVLFDTASPCYRGRPTFQVDGATVLATQAGFIAGATDPEFSLSADELRALPPAEQVELAARRLQSSAAVPPDLSVEHLRRVLRLYQCHAACLATYEPRPYAGEITLFRAREEHRILDLTLEHPAQGEPDYGWAELSYQPIRVVHVPGNHSTMIFEPCVAVLAERLDELLAASGSGRPVLVNPGLEG